MIAPRTDGGSPSLRGVPTAGLGALLLCFFFSLTLALVPVSVDCLGVSVGVSENTAYADEYLELDFIDQLAAEAGMSTGDFIATIVGCTSYATGMRLANENGIKMGMSASDALENLLDAADYPDWNTLNAEQQAVYGTKTNYDAAKLNSLLDAYGLEHAHDGFVGSGGGNLELGGDLKANLARIGRIGSMWASGASVQLGELVGLITEPQYVTSWLPQLEPGLTFDATNVADWPSGFPRSITVTKGNSWIVSLKFSTRNVFQTFATTTETYWVPYKATGTRAKFYYIVFEKQNFKQGTSSAFDNPSSVTSFSDVRSNSVNNQVVYYWNGNYDSSSYTYEGSSMVFNTYGSKLSDDDAVKVARAILFSDQLDSGGGEKMEGYPEQTPSDTTETYYPRDGLKNDTSWQQVLQDPGGAITPRPDNPYNPNDQTGGNEWKNDTTQNVLPIANLPFDKLFPFCLIFDLPLFFDKVLTTTRSNGVTVQSANQYNVITLEIPLSGEMEDMRIVLDLQPVEDFLLMVKPFVQIALLGMLLITAIRYFWSVITGA